MYGYSDEFKNALKTVKVATYTNTLKEKEGLVYTYDKIFLHSPTQRNCTTDNGEQSSTNYIEGEPWEYYKNLASGQSNLTTDGRFKTWNTYEILKRYALNNKSGQWYFSRSARRGWVYYVFSILTSGLVTIDNAYSTCRCLPACVI